MLTSTTNTLDGHTIGEYRGVLSAHCVEGLNAIKDFVTSVSDFVGGRSGTLEHAFAKADAKALEELVEAARTRGANALIGISFEHQIVNSQNQSSMLLVTVTGTAVVLTQPRAGHISGEARPSGMQSEQGRVREDARAGNDTDGDGVPDHPDRDRVAFSGMPE